MVDLSKTNRDGLLFATCFRAQNIDKTVRHLTMDACLWCSVLVPGIEPHFCDRFLGRRRRLGGKLVVSKSGCTRSGWGAGSPSPAAVREDVVNTSRVASVVLCLLDARSSALVAGDNGAALLLAADGWTSAAASSLRTFQRYTNANALQPTSNALQPRTNLSCGEIQASDRT